jgi:SAM-dependent methyltransferase
MGSISTMMTIDETLATAREWRRAAKHRMISSIELSSARAGLVESPDLDDFEVRMLDLVSLRVHHRDGMYHGDGTHYLGAGISALRCIRECLRVARADLRYGSILDFPSGHGRVMRFMRAAWPEACLTAGEIDGVAVAFCIREFDALGLHSAGPVGDLRPGARYDLIWCGSLLTHVDEALAFEFLRFFRDHLADGGLCLFTTHGAAAVERLRAGTEDYGLSEEGVARVIDGYDDGGYGYADYPKSKSYGISAAGHPKMAEIAGSVDGWDECHFIADGWDRSQDVHAWQAG